MAILRLGKDFRDCHMTGKSCEPHSVKKAIFYQYQPDSTFEQVPYKQPSTCKATANSSKNAIRCNQ